MPSVDALLPYLPPGSTGVEIGVAQAHSSMAMLRHGVGFLYLVDPWKPSFEEPRLECHASNLAEATKNLQEYADRCAILVMTSASAAEEIPENLDFVFIDGDHRYEAVKSELELYWPKIKSGGLLCGHDYCDAPPTCHVRTAVDEFVKGRSLRLNVLSGSCWLITKL